MDMDRKGHGYKVSGIDLWERLHSAESRRRNIFALVDSSMA